MSNLTNHTVKKRRDWQSVFLDSLANTLSVTKACAACRISRPYAYQHRSTHPNFAKAWDDAIDQAVDLAEAEMYRRAVEGIAKPVTVAGKREVIREYSDVLLIFALKAHRPEKYRDRIQVDTWRDKIIDGLRSGKVDPKSVQEELGFDLATELFVAAGISVGQSS